MEFESKGPGILMSDSLRGQVSGIGPDDVAKLQSQYVHVIVDRRVNGSSIPLVVSYNPRCLMLNPRLR